MDETRLDGEVWKAWFLRKRKCHNRKNRAGNAVKDTEETVCELNEKSKSAGISAEYKAAEINTNGKLSRELTGAVTQADFARESGVCSQQSPVVFVTKQNGRLFPPVYNILANILDFCNTIFYFYSI